MYWKGYVFNNCWSFLLNKILLYPKLMSSHVNVKHVMCINHCHLLFGCGTERSKHFKHRWITSNLVGLVRLTWIMSPKCSIVCACWLGMCCCDFFSDGNEMGGWRKRLFQAFPILCLWIWWEEQIWTPPCYPGLFVEVVVMPHFTSSHCPFNF